MHTTCPPHTLRVVGRSRQCGRRWPWRSWALATSSTSTSMARARPVTMRRKRVRWRPFWVPMYLAAPPRGPPGTRSALPVRSRQSICALALKEGFMPAGVNTKHVDPALHVNYLRESRSTALRHVMSNSFGFGGSNCSLSSGGRSEPARRLHRRRGPSGPGSCGLGGWPARTARPRVPREHRGPSAGAAVPAGRRAAAHRYAGENRPDSRT